MHCPFIEKSMSKHINMNGYIHIIKTVVTYFLCRKKIRIQLADDGRKS